MVNILAFIIIKVIGDIARGALAEAAESSNGLPSYVLVLFAAHYFSDLQGVQFCPCRIGNIQAKGLACLLWFWLFCIRYSKVLGV